MKELHLKIMSLGSFWNECVSAVRGNKNVGKSIGEKALMLTTFNDIKL